MVDAAEIRIWGHLVGAVRWDDSQKLGYFQYSPEFTKHNWDLSPLKMPISNGSIIYSFPENRKGRNDSEDTFKGLPGLLSDVIPDKFGNSLIHSWLLQNGRTENSMNPVEKLSFIGSRGMGALEFEPAQMKSKKVSFDIEFDSLIDIAKRITSSRESFYTKLNSEDEKAMKQILSIGTSAGGARPKAVIAFNSKTGEVKSGQGKINKGFEHWLIKLDGVSGEQFGSSSGWGCVEFAYYLMAKECNINISESRILEENGRSHFMTKRFDRDGDKKHHIQTFCGMQHYDYNDMFEYSYEQLFETMRLLSLNYQEAEEMFRRMVFNVIAKNCDDHTKNFSFILKQDEEWRLAPAYDLCFAFDESNHWVNQQTLSIRGKRNDIQFEDLMSIAKENNIKNGKKIIEQTISVVQSWKSFANEANVPQKLTNHIGKYLK